MTDYLEIYFSGVGIGILMGVLLTILVVYIGYLIENQKDEDDGD